MLNKWLRLLNIQKIIGRRKRNRGMVWATILGLGVGAAAYGVKKGNPNSIKKPIRNVMNALTRESKNIQMPNLAMAEFSKEISKMDSELLKDLNLDKVKR